MTLALIAAALAGIGSALLALPIVGLRDASRARVIELLGAYAAGVLLVVSFLDLIPEMLGPGTDAKTVALVLLVTMIGLALLDALRAIRGSNDTRVTVATLVLVGDTVHNLVDGMAIAAAFANSTRVGWAVTLAVAAHEIPQEVGNVAILIQHGMTPWVSLVLNVLSNATAVLGALAGALLFERTHQFVPYALAVSAASLVYVALAHLVPEMRQREGRSALRASIALCGGAVLMVAVERLLH